MLYLIALFLHVAGALIYSASLAIEWLSFSKLKKTESPEIFYDWFKTYSSLHIISGIAWTLLLIPGIYMMAVIWKSAAWVTISFVAFLVLVFVGSMISGIRMKPIIKGIKNIGFSLNIRSKLDDQLLNFSLKARTTLTLGIVFLMTVKPDMSNSILALLVSLLIAFVPLPQNKKE